MATWLPGSEEPVGKNEQLGRRLFDEPMLAGASTQKHFDGLDLRNFQETRTNEFSLDRLGRSSVDRRVISYLLPRGIAASQTFQKPKQFNGWVALRAETLTSPPKGPKLPIVPSPIGGEGLAENPYHAHALLEEPRDDYSTALHLRFLFGKYGTIQPIPSAQLQSEQHAFSDLVDPARALMSKLANWCRQRVRR